ncbi:MAG: multiphosphoryl transfer protein [Solirubrobacteraceae bacterium]|nr:multiphosphoryl transfer protein [Solirubrobacteraceae bacterium]
MRELRGLPTSPGLAVAPVHRLAAGAGGRRGGDAAAEVAGALAALECAAAQLDGVASRLRAEGREHEAEIVDTNAMMARDPGLAVAVEAALATEGMSAPDGILAACAAQADILAALDDPTLAARADDVRSIGRRAARLAGDGPAPSPAGEHVLVAEDLGPADVVELDPGVRAIVLAGGGPTAHAAIVARSLGIPMVTALGTQLEELQAGETVVVDGDAGLVQRSPDPARVAAAQAAADHRHALRDQARAASTLPAETVDGRRIAVLANVAGAGEVTLALDAGAEGIGLVRTELAFLEAEAWPTADEHRRALEPLLAALDGRPATVRVLDFGGDKLPPFLATHSERGLELLFASAGALASQLDAIGSTPAAGPVRVLLPMVRSAADLAAVRPLVGDLPLGPMIETTEALDDLDALAAGADYLSIGTNDLSAAVLGVDRFGGAPEAHDPRILAAIRRTVAAAQRAGIPLEVCGEAASDPRVLPLLVGLGVDEVSVGASRVGTVRAWIRALGYQECVALAEQAGALGDAATVAELVAPLAERLRSVERGDEPGERVERGGGVLAAGRQP